MSNRMNYKLFFSIILAMLMAMLPITAFAASDISDHWAKQEIDQWSSKGLIKGYPDNTFRPNNNITRAEFFALVNKVFGFEERVVVNFSDVSSSSWYNDVTAKAAAAGYVSGYPDGSIRPQAYITRQEAAKVVVKAFGLEDKAALSLSEFKDSNQIETWARNYVAVMKAKGFISGYADGTFGPANNLKRAEGLRILANASGDIVNQAGIYSKEIKGNLVVNVSNVILKDMKIAGDLYLAEGIGDGEVTLDGVMVKGKTMVRGGGENSIILKNSTLAEVEVNKPRGSGQQVRLVSEGSTSVSGTLTVNSGAKLEEKNLDPGAIGFTNIIVSEKLPETAKVHFAGDFKEVTIAANKGLIEISKAATISTVSVQAAAKVVIAEGAKVTSVNVTETAKGANIEAKAEVKIVVKAENVIVNNSSIAVGSTASVSAGGTTTTTTSITTPATSGGSSDSGSSITATSVILAVPGEGIIPHHFDAVVKNTQTNTSITGLVVGDFSLKKGDTDIPLNAEAFQEQISDNPDYNKPGRYTIYPIDEYRPMAGEYTLTFSKSGYVLTSTTFQVDTPVDKAALTGAQVTITTGSAVFNYAFYGSSLSPITYDEALAAPYNLNLAASTVRLEKRSGETVAQATYNIKLDALNIISGSVSYGDLNAVEAAFGNPSFMNVWQGPPTHVVLELQGGLGEDAWVLNPITIQLQQSDLNAFETIMPAVYAYTPGEGGSMPAFTPLSGNPGKIGGLLVEKSHRVNNLFGEGNSAVIEFSFTPPQEFGAASYTLQFSGDNGSTWQNYQNNAEDVTTSNELQDNFVIYPSLSYSYRLLVNGGNNDGATSNEVEAPLSNVATTYTGWSLDESMWISGVITPYLGSGKEAAFSAAKLPTQDNTDLTQFLSYQWYRVNPLTYEMELIPNATGLTYITTPADAGYMLLCRATGDGENVGGFSQILSHYVTVLPNKAYITNVTNSGFRLNLYKSVSGLLPEELKLGYYNDQNQLVPVSINSITHIEQNAVFDVSANIPSGVSSLQLENTSPFWRLVTEISGQMIIPNVEITPPMLG